MASLSGLKEWLASQPDKSEPAAQKVEVHVDMSPLNDLVEMFRSMLAGDGSLRVTDRVTPRP